MFTTIIFIIVLSILVFAHELGHFWAARKFGVKAEEFGFGYPPRVAGIYKSKNGAWKKVIGNKEVNDASDTIYSINLIPIGGFVKIKGEDGPEIFEGRTDTVETSHDASKNGTSELVASEDGASNVEMNHDTSKSEENINLEVISEAALNDSLVGKPIWQRAIIMSAGVTMNIILAAFLLSIGFMIGLPQSVDGLGSRAIISDPKVQVAQVLSDSPASKAGLQIGDVILDIEGTTFLNEKEVQDFTRNNLGNNLKYNIKRGDTTMVLEIEPVVIEESSEPGVGIAVITGAMVRYPWYIAIWEGVRTTAFMTWFIIIAFVQLIWSLVTGHGIGMEVAGPVGIASLTGQFARLGFVYLMQFTALLSINLAVINFLPFPALDGGHVLFLIIEKIKGSPVRKELASVIHGIGFALLMVLVLFITVKEIIGLF